MPFVQILIAMLASAALTLGALALLTRMPLRIRIVIFFSYCAAMAWLASVLERHLYLLMGHVAIGFVFGLVSAFAIVRLRWQTRQLAARALIRHGTHPDM